MSLTVAEIVGSVVRVNIIPATYEGTTLKDKKTGDSMNLETDILGRYMVRLLGPRLGVCTGLSPERMKELGY
jgi:riboflavin synthase